jgi:hypothetical protein
MLLDRPGRSGGSLCHVSKNPTRKLTDGSNEGLVSSLHWPVSERRRLVLRTVRRCARSVRQRLRMRSRFEQCASLLHQFDAAVLSAALLGIVRRDRRQHPDAGRSQPRGGDQQEAHVGWKSLPPTFRIRSNPERNLI